MSNLFQGLVSSAVTVYGVYKLGKTAYTINHSPPNSSPSSHGSNDDINYKNISNSYENNYEKNYEKNYENNYEYYNEESISDKIIFIPKQYTERAIYENYLLEEFESNKQLFYYLRRRSNMEAIHENLRIFNFNLEYNNNNKHIKHNEILIFCTDLHSKSNPSNTLYIVGILNDKTPSNTNKKQIIEKWKMNQYFLTAYDICNKYGIQFTDLPTGSYNKLQKEISNINMNKLLYTKNNISSQAYSSLKCIKTTKPLYNNNMNNNNNNYNITKTKFYKAIKQSNILEPIISFSEDKNIYYIDMILLVELCNNHWIGIIFRDYTKNNNYIPIDIAIDCYDIRNKMILYKPPNNIQRYKQINKYKNNIIKINIINNNEQINENDMNMNNNNEEYNEYLNDLECKLMEANKRINELENQVMKHNKTINKQSRDIAVLKEQNNHYFQQCLNPHSNIKPHSIHLRASKAAPVTIFYTKK